jgi:diaminohydroxyphosphoribosylaminopyrimidine deaminase / 5-amino-6-(5-phosphoribosylamino)uracil reductase
MNVAARASTADLRSADAMHLAAAFALGRRNLGDTWPNPAVGAVILDAEGRVAGRGWTQAGGRPHAETEALRRAGELAKGGTLYVTLEPCSHQGKTPPCADAVVAAGIRRVVVPIEDSNPLVAGKGIARLRAAGIEVVLGPGAERARREHAGHICRIRRGRPHVQLKLALSADGKVGLKGRRPAAITGEAALGHAHLMRAEADAIAVGIGTVLSDDPQLTCRLPGMEQRSPIRIAVDARLRIPLDAALVRSASDTPTWILAAEDAPADAELRLRDAGVEVLRVPAAERGLLDMEAALSLLAARGLTRLLVEGGPILAASMLDARLVDEVTLFESPVTLGHDAIPAVDGRDLRRMLEPADWTVVVQRMLGPDRFTDLWRR